MDPLSIILLILGGTFAGFVNTLAGGGSFLTLPILVFAGLDAQTANGTNRIAVLIQSLFATIEFGRHGKLPGIRATLILVAPAVVGAVAGARTAVEVPEPALRVVIGVILLLAIPTVIRPEGRRTSRDEERIEADRRSVARPGILALLFLCGFYGGFLQAGVGLLLIAVLVPLVGLDLVRANAVKVLLVTVYSIMAIPVFAASGQITLLPGLVLAIGNVLGAFVATRFAFRGGARAVRWVLVAALVLAAAALLDLPARLGLG
jgi:uncharacterized membrane protein YfcA